MTIGQDLIHALGGGSHRSGNQPPTYRIALATIPSGYTSGRPTLLFDGETTATTRKYPYLSSYTPAANDRVMVVLYNRGGCVLGKIV